ncbi:MAG TPA: hypothetical protein VGN17_09400 [Bryobacteraceae bacterium]|jgi:hypothetical protein
MPRNNIPTKTAALLLFGLTALAQSSLAQTQPDLSGVWSPSRATGPGAPAPPTPILLKAPYKEPYEARRALERAATARGEQLAAPGSLCSPYGMPTMMQVAVYPMELIQTPKQVTIVAEAFSEVRRIYLGKTQISFDDVSPGYYGHSVGRWEGDTLVVDTIGVKPNVKGYQGMPHSDDMRITERIRRPSAKTLHDQITIEDPKVLEKPVTYTLVYALVPDYEMVEFVCENNREYVDEKGVVRMRLGGSGK